MKKYLLSLMAAISLTAFAGNIEYNGVYYRALPEAPGDCAVTWSEKDPYAFAIAVPEEISDGEETYRVVAVDDYAFSGCDCLLEVSLPESVTRLGRNAFYGCIRLEHVMAPGVEEVGQSCFSNCELLGDLCLSEDVMKVGDSAFINCRQLTAFTFQTGATLGNNVFYGCTSLKKVTLPSNISEIPPYTFYGCTSLQTVSGTSRVTEIGDFAFYSCELLETIDVSSRLEAIGSNAFGFCSSLSMERLAGTGLKIGSFAFTDCENISSLQMEGVEEIENDAFNATSLKKVTFDAAIRKIGERAFGGCEDIVFVGCLAEIPPVMGNHAFPQTVYDRATLEVPFGKGLLYKMTPPWSYFLTVTEGVDSGLGSAEIDLDNPKVTVTGDTLSITGDACQIEIYGISGIKVFEGFKGEEEMTLRLPQRGVYLVRAANRIIKVIAR